VEFDHKWARVVGAKAADDATDGLPRVAQEFINNLPFTCGLTIQYERSSLTGAPTWQHLATGFDIGKRFHSAPVVRLADARPVQLGHAGRADGAWRIYVFADPAAPASPDSRARRLCDFLSSSASPTTRFTPVGGDPDSVIDVRAVFQQFHRDLAVDTLPPALLPRKGRFGLVDHEKAFSADPKAGDVFDLRGIDRDAGCMVVVRPDQYVAHVLPLDAHEELSDFFAGILVQPPTREAPAPVG